MACDLQAVTRSKNNLNFTKERPLKHLTTLFKFSDSDVQALIDGE